MVRKDFVDVGLYPTYILPSTKRSPPPPSVVPFPHLQHLSIVVERTVLYVPTQSPLCTVAPFLCVATRDPVTILFNIIACVFCVTPHPCWHRGPLGQDCLSVVIARLPEARSGTPKFFFSAPAQVYPSPPSASKTSVPPEHVQLKQDVHIRICMRLKVCFPTTMGVMPIYSVVSLKMLHTKLMR